MITVPVGEDASFRYEFNRIIHLWSGMAQTLLENAARLSEHLAGLTDFVVVKEMDGNYGHMGATIADAILQAGLNYETVVRPRISRIRAEYPDARTTSAFSTLLDTAGVKEVLNWRDDVKPNRVRGLTAFLLAEKIETETELALWLTNDENRRRLRTVSGIGPKTLDYIGILVGEQTTAVDRHILGILEQASISCDSYDAARDTVNAAADLMRVQRALLDHSIWRYMRVAP